MSADGERTVVQDADPPRSSVPPGDILTSREARELLKVGRTKLWELTRTNAIPAYRVGHGKTARLRYRRSELLEWLEHMRI
jgi:excisionase family DNA binding protein